MLRQRNKSGCLILILVMVALVCALLCYDNAASSPATRMEVKALVAQKQDRLQTLIQQADGTLLCYDDDPLGERLDWRNRLRFFGTGLDWVNGRHPDEWTDFWFRSQYPEGGLHLYYSPSGEEAVLALCKAKGFQYTAIPESGVCQDIPETGGFIYCEKLQPDWYLVEWNLPT